MPFRKPTCCSPSACASTIVHRQSQDVRAGCQEDPHRNRSRRNQQERKGGCITLVGDIPQKILKELLPRVQSVDHTEWLDCIDKLKGDSAVPDDPESRQRTSIRRARHQRPVARDSQRQHRSRDRRRRHQRESRRNTSARKGAVVNYIGWTGDHGLCPAGGHRGRAARLDANLQGHRRRRRLSVAIWELTTIQQEKLKIDIAIINNGFLGMVRQWQEFFYGRNYEATPLLNPDS